MQGWIARLRELGLTGTARLATDSAGLLVALSVLAFCVVADILLGNESAALVGTYVAAPFVAALLSGPKATALVGVLAVGAAAASPSWNVNTEFADQVVRLGVILAGSVFAVGGSWLRTRTYGRTERLELLDSVGAIADGSLPLAETLRRVTEVMVPAFGDICMVDAVHDGRSSRLAARAHGREDAAVIGERMYHRSPDLPSWLIDVERSWRDIPRWRSRLRDEEVRRMAESPEDLAFLRTLGLRSSIVAPIRARDRNLGALTLLSAWSERRYSAADVRFAQILASRIGLALDNAGLFSDLESVERRMDTVMSILDEAVVIHNVDGELVFANPAAARSLGYETSEQAISTPKAISERFTIRDEAGKEVASDALAGRAALPGAEVEPVTLRVTDRVGGRERWMRTKARVIEGTQGEALYSVTAIEDVTDVKRAEFSHRLLARSGELLSHSTDYRRTLDRVPHLVVPEFADWCAVEMPEPGSRLRRVASAHRDPTMFERAERMRERYPVFADDDAPVGVVMRTGVAQRFDLTEEQLSSIATDDAHLEELRALAIRSCVIAPMSAGGAVVGALVLVNHEGSRAFDDEDLAVAVELAQRAALAIENARLAEERTRVADALQRELLPPSLPRMPGWQVATMYEPAGEINQVGGDFYEVFPVDDGWAVVLGDVSGKGAAAAALTAEARHTIRTAGVLSDDPRRGFYLLDENLRERDDAALCSAAMVVVPADPTRSSEVTVYLAGHPHPMLMRGGEATPVGNPGPMLGVVDDPVWDGVTVSVEPGDQLVLYTDGVIEARGRDGERFGEERLRDGLAGSTTPDSAVEQVRGALDGFGAEGRQDDAAVVVVRRRPAAGASARRLGTVSTPADHSR